MNLDEEFHYFATFDWKNWKRAVSDVEKRPWRTVKNIIKSGFFYGCTEAARLLVWRATQEGIPTRFLAFIDIQLSSDREIVGHCYVELLLDGQWIKVDPTRRQVVNCYPSNYFLVTDQMNWNSFAEFNKAHVVFLRKFRKKHVPLKN